MISIKLVKKYIQRILLKTSTEKYVMRDYRGQSAIRQATEQVQEILHLKLN